MHNSIENKGLSEGTHLHRGWIHIQSLEQAVGWFACVCRIHIHASITRVCVCTQFEAGVPNSNWHAGCSPNAHVHTCTPHTGWMHCPTVVHLLKWKCRTPGKLQWDQSSLCLLICTVHNVIQNKQYTGTHDSWIHSPQFNRHAGCFPSPTHIW